MFFTDHTLQTLEIEICSRIEILQFVSILGLTFVFPPAHLAQK
jgi:hypothetical protein